mmetsp:Transcript_5781/g.9507  ORF Transcript_5781/g.9507 Transcript_5781/m.9507 type:complete len:89 (-) Transcript_5781:389-655(-)
MTASMDREQVKKELRKVKNRESAERNRKEKDDAIEALQSKIYKLSADIHSAMVENWYMRSSLSCSSEQKLFTESFPKYVPPILEPAVF